MLNEKLNRQVKIGWSILGVGIAVIIGAIITIVGIRNSVSSLDSSDTGLSTAAYIGIAIIVIAQIASFVLWIIGIVNAVQINGITGDSTVLVIFSVFTFWFGALLVAISQRNKFAHVGSMGARRSTANGHATSHSYEAKLKESFTSGVITSAEYEKKLKEHKSKK